MTGRKEPQIQDLPRRGEGARARHWLLLGITVCAAALAGSPPAAAPQRVPPSSSAGQAPSDGAPDVDFIEFLGREDMGDATWWEFLNKVPVREGNPPATPPQEARQ